ncbi:MAG: hypothetical protein LIO62_07065 [Clostridiales bacterium]|nr:hypothetical protein [Clostridiales bacterium]
MKKNEVKDNAFIETTNYTVDEYRNTFKVLEEVEKTLYYDCDIWGEKYNQELLKELSLNEAFDIISKARKVCQKAIHEQR